AAFEEPARLHARFGVVDELQELAAAQVSARRGKDGEPVEGCDCIGGWWLVAGSWRLGAGWRTWRSRRSCASAGSGPGDQVGMRGAGRHGARHDAQRPARFGGRGEETHLVVAGLIPQAQRDDEVAGLERGGKREARPDEELALEDGERLILSFLFE